MDLCPVCAWEDIYGESDYDGARERPLAQDQRRFLATGVSQDGFEGAVRPPLAEEARSAGWQPFDELRLQVIKDIEKEFHDVGRDGGTTLNQMRLVDGGYPAEDPLMKEAGHQDPEIRWQDIPAGKLSRFSQSLVFLDSPGFRFYLPAFMRHALFTGESDISDADLDGVLWSLDSGPHGSYRRGSFALLSAGQKKAIASFVFLVATYGEGSQALYAIKGLKHGWEAFVPDFLKLALL